MSDLLQRAATVQVTARATPSVVEQVAARQLDLAALREKEKAEQKRVKEGQISLRAGVLELLAEDAAKRLPNGERNSLIGHYGRINEAADIFAMLKWYYEKNRNGIMKGGRFLVGSEFDVVESKLIELVRSETGRKRYERELAEPLIFEAMLIAKWGRSAPDAKERLSDTEFDFFVAAHRFTNVARMADLPSAESPAKDFEIGKTIPALKIAGRNLHSRDSFDRATYPLLSRAHYEPDWFKPQEIGKLINQAIYLGWNPELGEAPHPNRPRLDRYRRPEWSKDAQYALD